MAAFALRVLARFDRVVQPGSLGGEREVHFGQVQPRAGGGFGKVVAQMPVLHAPAPDRFADRIEERQAKPACRCQLTEPGQAVDMRLVLGISARGHVHQHRIGARPAEWQAQEFGAAVDVAQEVAEPQRIAVRKEIGLAHRDRINRADIATHIVIAFELDQPTGDEIAVGRPERPVQVISQGHALSAPLVLMLSWPARPASRWYEIA